MPNRPMLALTFQQITHPDDLAADEAKVPRGAGRPGADLPDGEARTCTGTGTRSGCLLGVSLVRDSAGEPLHLVAQVQDITGRKAAEEALRRRPPPPRRRAGPRASSWRT